MWVTVEIEQLNTLIQQGVNALPVIVLVVLKLPTDTAELMEIEAEKILNIPEKDSRILAANRQFNLPSYRYLSKAKC